MLEGLLSLTKRSVGGRKLERLEQLVRHARGKLWLSPEEWNPKAPENPDRRVQHGIWARSVLMEAEILTRKRVRAVSSG